MRIGAHIHTGEGLEQAARYASETGCECVQVFAKSPQSWRGPRKDPDELERFRASLSALGIGPVFTHASYLINLGSADEALWARSTEGLADELERAAGFGAAGVVIHMGTAYASGRAESAARVAGAVESAWRCASEACAAPPVLLENAAGAGRSYGWDAEQICDALEACAQRGVPVGLCLDTCHGFAAGWDLRTPVGWSELCDRLGARGALEAVALVHANDSKGGHGERRDRHEWIGDGLIGESGFAAMFGEARLRDVPAIVEMPGETPDKDAVNIRRLRVLRASAGAGGGPVPASAAPARG